jgi:extracellular elastinolytic metalloproteinase
MRLKLVRRAALAAALSALALPASALGTARISDHADVLADYDARVGAVAPTRTQRSAVRKLHASVTWNRFGTPATLSRRGKYLAKGVRGKNAVIAARRWIHYNRALFRLYSTAGLELAGDTTLASSRGHAVNFQQMSKGLATAEGGHITVALTGSAKKGWNVAYVSSSLTRDTAVDGRAKLSGAQAWLRAADSVGVDGYSLAHVLEAKTTRGWTHLAIGGLGDLQQVRAVAFPTIRSGLVPAFESIVLKGKDAIGFKIVVDARNGKVLTRTNLVHNFTEGNAGIAAAEAYTYSGELAATDGACNTHGPFAIGAGNRALDGFSAATVPLNDLVLELYKDGVLLAHADTLFSPEQFHYEPVGGVPAGNYEIKVCDFADGAGWSAPRTYTGTLTGDASPVPPAYLARWKVFPANPPLYTVQGFPWNFPDTDTREVWCWVGAAGCNRVIGNLASRGPWDHDHKLNTPTLTTRGNNAKSATSWTSDILPSSPQYMPVSATRDYNYPWTNSWNNDQCEPVPNGPPGATWDDSASTVNLFVSHNRIHDFSYFLGFTERNWNAQDYNFGLTERRQENDPIIGDAQSGALTTTRDNANMITLPDGLASITNMYFWQPIQGAFYAPCVDGDYDMGVIGHEYGHMIENRMIGKGDARTGHHAGAMGESFGDLNGMEYQNENGFVPTGDENRYAVGTYDTGNKLRAIRNYGMNFPMSGGVPEPGKQLMINALNFSDMGYDVTGPQVHADGEIWSATNFRIRTLLNDKYDDDFPSDDEDLQYACANGELPPYACPGNRRWFQLYYDAMLLMPTGPSMLQARDAILTADLMRFGGANQREIWLGFARSGYGQGAVSSNTTADTDIDPTPSFKSPLHDNAVIKFRARGKDGNTTISNARIYVGHYEARVSPIADTNPATTGLNLDDVAEFAPGTYELVAHAPGYGHLRGRKTFHRGENSIVEFRFPTNHAAAAKGATATGDGTTPGNLIDDTERTQWTAEGTIVGGNLSVDGRKVTIDLAGTESVRVDRLQVSAHLAAGQSRFTALRQFEVWACNNDRPDNDNCSLDSGYHRVYTSRADAFPADPPRPVAPHLILREFDISRTRATHLRFVVKTSQCTGAPTFQGEQDADPRFTTDCDSNVPANAPFRFVRAAEFQAFSQEGSVNRH